MATVKYSAVLRNINTQRQKGNGGDISAALNQWTH